MSLDLRSTKADSGVFPEDAASSGQFRFKTPCLVIALVLISILLVINPLVMTFLVKEKARFELPYVLLVDTLVVGVLWRCNAYLRDGDDRQFRIVTAALIAFPFVLGAAEVLLLEFRALWVPFIHGESPTVPKASEVEPHPALGWTLRPGYAERPGLMIDDQGRRHITQTAGADKPTLHAFGDSFLFGMGVSQEQNALNLVASAFDQRINVLNYAVNGYGLEQMLLRFEEALETVDPGDLVLFSPISDDLRRNLIAKSQVCVHDRVGLTADRFPRLVNDQWQFEQIADHCPELRLPLADLAWSLGEDLGWVENTLLDNADHLMARAKRLAEARGATFLLLFQPMLKECRKGRFDLDVSRLSVPHDHLLDACNRLEEGIVYTRRSDHHWNARGHRWLADALIDYLEPRL